MKLILFLGLLFCFTCKESPAQHGSSYNLKERKASHSNDTFDSILLISTGSTLDRLFADNLSIELQNFFRKNSSTIQYQFITVDTKDTCIYIDSKSIADIDAVLFLIPDSLSALSIRIKSTPISYYMLNSILFAPIPQTVQKKRVTHYQQNFVLTLLNGNKSDNSLPIWEASLQTNFNPTRNNIYASIAKKLVKHFRKNGII